LLFDENIAYKNGLIILLRIVLIALPEHAFLSALCESTAYLRFFLAPTTNNTLFKSPYFKSMYILKLSTITDNSLKIRIKKKRFD